MYGPRQQTVRKKRIQMLFSKHFQTYVVMTNRQIRPNAKCISYRQVMGT